MSRLPSPSLPDRDTPPAVPAISEEDAILLEAVRYAELEQRNSQPADEYDAVLYAVWYLLNPLGLRRPKSIGTVPGCDTVLTPKRKQFFAFTAHSHHNKPLEVSPDDLLLYARQQSSAASRLRHFLTDRFHIHPV